MSERTTIIQELTKKFGDIGIQSQEVCDHIPTLWVSKDKLADILHYLKSEISGPYPMLYDLTAIDERVRYHRQGQPPSDFTVVYHLLSFARNEDVRIKVALSGKQPSLP